MVRSSAVLVRSTTLLVRSTALGSGAQQFRSGAQQFWSEAQQFWSEAQQFRSGAQQCAGEKHMFVLLGHRRVLYTAYYKVKTHDSDLKKSIHSKCITCKHKIEDLEVRSIWPEVRKGFTPTGSSH